MISRISRRVKNLVEPTHIAIKGFRVVAPARRGLSPATADFRQPQAAMKQIAGELTNDEDGFLNGKRYLIMDRDTK